MFWLRNRFLLISIFFFQFILLCFQNLQITQLIQLSVNLQPLPSSWHATQGDSARVSITHVTMLKGVKLCWVFKNKCIMLQFFHFFLINISWGYSPKNDQVHRSSLLDCLAVWIFLIHRSAIRAKWSWGDIMVSVLVSRSSSLGSSPERGHCI